MSVLWLIRLILLGFLFFLIMIFAYFLKNRDRYSNLLENATINLVSVILFNVFCYVPMILPSLESVITIFLNHKRSVKNVFSSR